MSKTKENQRIKCSFQEDRKELNQLKEELLKYNEKTQNLSDEVGYQKDINKILIKKVRDI